MTNNFDNVKGEGQESIVYSVAAEQAGFGCYQYILLVICGLITASISGPASSFLGSRHAIICDFMIDYDQQMRIDAYTIIALISGGIVVAIPTDLIGRLKPFVISLIFYGLGTLALGFCSGYKCFALFSVFRAFWVSALLSVMTVYVAELHIPRFRGAGLCFLQIFRLIGLVVLPVSSVPWRASHFIFGILATIVAIPIVRYLTESHRFLLSLEKQEGALESLAKIYKRNSAKGGNEYPVKALVDDFSQEAQNVNDFRTYVPKAMRPPWYCPIVILQIGFVFNLCYFTMSYWFKQIRYHDALLFPIKIRQIDCKFGVKSLVDKYLPAMEVSLPKKNVLDFYCNPSNIDADYYKEVSITALVTLPFLIWMILHLDQLGRSFFIVLSHVISGLLSFFLHFVIRTEYALFYTSLMESMWIITSTTSSCLATEFFKTRFRVLGVGLANSLGYLGMAIGLHGLLLNEGVGCIFVMSFTGILMTASGLLTLSLPDVVGVHLK